MNKIYIVLALYDTANINGPEKIVSIYADKEKAEQRAEDHPSMCRVQEFYVME